MENSLYQNAFMNAAMAKLNNVIYQTDDYSFLQIKEKNFIDRFKPSLYGV